jgi:hypothetical protein
MFAVLNAATEISEVEVIPYSHASGRIKPLTSSPLKDSVTIDPVSYACLSAVTVIDAATLLETSVDHVAATEVFAFSVNPAFENPVAAVNPPVSFVKTAERATAPNFPPIGASEIVLVRSFVGRLANAAPVAIDFRIVVSAEVTFAT